MVVSSEIRNALSVYPNPVEKQMTIAHMKTDTDSWAEVYDVGGLLLAKSKLAPNAVYTQFDVSKLSPGVYLLMITTDSQSQSTRFLVK